MKLSLHKNKTLTPSLARYTRAHAGIDPHRVWDLLLLASALLLVFSILFALFLFHRILDNDLFNADTIAPSQVTPVQRNKLDTVLKRFDDRALLENEILSQAPMIIDPSVSR